MTLVKYCESGDALALRQYLDQTYKTRGSDDLMCHWFAARSCLEAQKPRKKYYHISDQNQVEEMLLGIDKATDCRHTEVLDILLNKCVADFFHVGSYCLEQAVSNDDMERAWFIIECGVRPTCDLAIQIADKISTDVGLRDWVYNCCFSFELKRMGEFCRSCVIQAIQQRHEKTLDMLVRFIKINNTHPLSLALKQRDIRIIRLIAKVSSQNSLSVKFKNAVELGYEVAEIFLQLADCPSSWPSYALIWCISKGDIKLTRLLLDYEVGKRLSGNSLVEMAIKSENLEMLELVMGIVNRELLNHEQCLQEALHNKQMFAYLVKCGLNGCTKRFGELELAVKTRDMEFVTMAVKHGAFYRDVVRRALMDNDMEVLEAIAVGVPINQTTCKHLLNELVKHNQLNIVELILQQGFNPRWKNGKLILNSCSLEMDKLLFKYGVNPRSRGCAALIRAALNGDDEYVRYLLSLAPDMAYTIKPSFSPEVLKAYLGYGDADVLFDAIGHFKADEQEYIYQFRRPPKRAVCV